MLSKAQSKILHKLNTRHGRKKSPYFVCEGVRSCREALARRPEWVEFIVCTEGFNDPETERLLKRYAPMVLKDRDINEFSQTENPQGILVVLRRPDFEPGTLGASESILVLDGVSDPGNVGTILRTAWAVGLASVAWTAGSCDPFGPKAVRAGMGAQFVLDLPKVDSIQALAGICPHHTMWLTMPGGAVSCYDDRFSLKNGILVLGNEAHGIEHFDGANTVHIPMPGGAESLNVAQAATVVLFEAYRRGQLGTSS